MPEPYRVDEAGALGLFDSRDRRPSQLPKQAWSSGRNFRCANGSAFAVPGYAQDIDITDPTIHALDYYSAATGQHKIVYGDQLIRTVNASGALNIVKDMGAQAGTYPTELWVTDQFNSIPIATNNVGPPQCQYAGGGPIDETTPFVVFPDWGPGGTFENATCLLVAAYGNFIVALNIVDNGNFPNLIAWSDLAEPGLMPSNWDYTQANFPGSLAGRRVIGAGDGDIKCARVQRGNLMIYCERGTHRLTFVPGSEFVMDNDRVFDNFGAFGPRAVGSYGAQHLVVTKDDVVRHDGQQHTSVADGRIRKLLFETLKEEDTNRVFVEPYLRNSEMLFGVPNADNEFRVALAYRWADPGQPWSPRDLPNVRHVKELPILEQSAVDDSWEGGPDESWDGGQDIIWDFGISLGDLQLQGASGDGYLYTLDAEGQTITAVLERSGINLFLDDALETITELIPRIQASQPVTIEIGGQMVVDGPIKWAVPATFDPLNDHHVTRLVTGRRHAIRITGLDFRVDGYDINWEFHGED